MSELRHPESECPVARFLIVLEGPWATLLVRELLTGPKRFTELRRLLPGISPRTLSARLKQLEKNGLVIRTTYPEVPPRVDYRLTPAGSRLDRVLIAMAEWAERDLPRWQAPDDE